MEKIQKKANPAKPGAVSFLIFELVENYGFVLVRSILEKGGKKFKKKQTLRSQVRFPFLFLNSLKTMDLFWSGQFCTGNLKKTNKKKPERCVFCVFYKL